MWEMLSGLVFDDVNHEKMLKLVHGNEIGRA